MSQDTHSGFSGPFSSFGVTIVRSFARAPVPPHLQSAAPPVAVTTVGVGQNPDALSEVGRASVGSSQNSPSSIKPHLGQVPENSAKPPNSEHWAVFHEREARSYFADDAGHFSPEAGSLSVESCALAGRADVLAWEAPRNHVNNSAPRRSVEGTYIIPNGERWNVPFILSLHESSCAVGVSLHGAHGPPPEQLASKNAASTACEKCQLIHLSSVHCRPASTDFSKTANTSFQRTGKSARR
jgi:hypothetical protein